MYHYHHNVMVYPADFQQVIVNKDDVPPEEQQWSRLVDQEDPEPPHIKEEQEEPWTNQDGQQLQGLEEADIKFTLTPVTVKSEEDEEKLKSSKLHPSETKKNRADCGGPEPARNSGPDGRLQPGPEDKTEDSSETEETVPGSAVTGRIPSCKAPVPQAEAGRVGHVIVWGVDATAGLLFLLYLLLLFIRHLSGTMSDSCNSYDLLAHCFDLTFSPGSDSRREGGEKDADPVKSNRVRCWLGVSVSCLWLSSMVFVPSETQSAERRNMSAVQLLRMSVHERISAAAEDFLLQVEEGGGKARVPELRAKLSERLMAAVEQILAGLEKTLLEYEGRVERAEQSEWEICRQRRLLDGVMQPKVWLHRAVCPADIKQLMVIIEEVPPEEQKDSRADCGGPDPARNSGPDGRLQPGPEDETEDSSETEDSEDDWMETREPQTDIQQVIVNKEDVPPEEQHWSPLVDQEDPEPHHIKEEQKEPWTNQDGQQLQGLEEADIKFTLTPVAVKSEEDEEKLKSSKLHPSETKENRADCGGPEPARNSGPDGRLQPGPEDKTEDSSETEETCIVGPPIFLHETILSSSSSSSSFSSDPIPPFLIIFCGLNIQPCVSSCSRISCDRTDPQLCGSSPEGREQAEAGRVGHVVVWGVDATAGLLFLLYLLPLLLLFIRHLSGTMSDSCISYDLLAHCFDLTSAQNPRAHTATTILLLLLRRRMHEVGMKAAPSLLE
ncbi:unnamed protein product [Pleuronectes platessa]|uniref:Uncharacterized protein n=1 Tax=Pleuronectes platessa TaxID=8262 RepID=A0A9N7YBW0_PLEPL|nr:unnamed protein product [Pleuronectes platessa]